MKNTDSTELNKNDIQFEKDENLLTENKDNDVIMDIEQTDIEKNAELNNITWCSGFSIPVPKPETEYIASYDYGAFCYDFNSEQLKDYLNGLESDGWSCIDATVFDEKTHYTYTKEDMIFQIVDHTKTKELSSNDTATSKASEESPKAVENLSVDSFILVNFSYGNEKRKQRLNTLSKSEAAKLISEHIIQLATTDSEYQTTGGSKVTMIMERFLKDSHEKMGLQAFTVFNANNRLIGNYLICNQRVLYVMDSLNDVCVADIDQDDEWELLSLYGWGSGIYRIELNAYKYENPIYFSSNTKILHCIYRNCFVPKDGYGKLTLNKMSETEVSLQDHDWLAEESEGYTGEPDDYGRIIIAADGIHLIPEKLKQFPYDQWDYAYDQANIPSIKENDALNNIENALEEPPLINITVGEKKIDYEVRKTLWNGLESSESSSFTDLMENKEELPLFESPKHGFEFQDTILMDFGDFMPESIKVKDYLLSASGGMIYSDKSAIDREVKIEGEGKFSFGLYQHFALMLSSNSATYENPSYRGFRVICTFSEDKICEYAFTLSLGPIW